MIEPIFSLDKSVELSENGLSVKRLLKKREVIPLQDIVRVYPDYVVGASWSMDMNLRFVFEIKNKSPIYATFDDEDVENVYRLLSKPMAKNLSKERKIIEIEYRSLVESLKIKILIRNILAISLMIITFGVFFFFIPDKDVHNETIGIVKRILVCTLISLIVSGTVIVMFALVIGRNNYARYKSLITRQNLYNLYWISNKKETVLLDKSKYDSTRGGIFKPAGILSICLGGIMLVLIPYLFFIDSTSFEPSHLLILFGSVGMIGVGFYFLRLAKKKQKLNDK